jgi:molybdenum cofactor sulfurtransferase
MDLKDSIFGEGIYANIFATETIVFVILTLGLIILLSSLESDRRKLVKFEENLKWKRKKEFLFRVGDSYGYRGTKGGFIDEWRPKELPMLQKPLLCTSEIGDDNDGVEREIYMDYAGSALPTKSQLEKCFTSSCAAVLANPHSTGPAASRTLAEAEMVKNKILNHFHAAPGRFASLNHPPSSLPLNDRHPGYDIVFTSGATEALRIVAERFPWSTRCDYCGRQSILLYAQNSHSSVLGMRELALRKGAAFYCRDIAEIQKMKKKSFQSLENQFMNNSEEKRKNCECCREKIRHLLVFSAECNFGGHRPDSRHIISTARESGWFTMLDIAKAASTGPIDLQQENPDFACLSYYKIFGEPTGLGSLFVKRSAVPILFEKEERNYVGGGSLNIILATQDFHSQPKNVLSLTSGSNHFRGILKVSHGFDEVDRLGGMSKIHQHAKTLAHELTRRLHDLVHGNGRQVVVIYGAWRNSTTTSKLGPTIALNIQRDDGSIIGYNEVSKLAALHKPAIQFRTGCFCNPGACQKALNLTDEELIHNFEITGHVCGDHIDIINQKPTGAIRISFGKDSSWEDLDEFVLFIKKTFVKENISTFLAGEAASNKDSQVELSELYIFPIKSCASQRVPRWKVDLQSGKLLYDREFALVSTSGTAFRLQDYPKMGMISPVINLDEQTLTVKAPDCEDLVLSLLERYSACGGGDNEVGVCGTKCGGRLWGGYEASEWFTSFLGVQCWLARYSKLKTQTTGDRNESSMFMSGPRSSYANEKPLLLISDNAVRALNGVLAEQKQNLVGSKHFRPNMVVRSQYDERSHHMEDDWQKLVLKDAGLTLQVTGSCARCSMVDFDPSTGLKGKTLRALAKYRLRKGQITFGIFLQAIPDETKKIMERGEAWIQEGENILCSY